MNRQLAFDFLQLRVSERNAVCRQLDIVAHQGGGEKNIDFAMRVLTEVDNAGKIRQLEAMLVECKV